MSRAHVQCFVHHQFWLPENLTLQKVLGLIDLTFLAFLNNFVFLIHPTSLASSSVGALDVTQAWAHLSWATR
jgi:hypothetical protein